MILTDKKIKNKKVYKTDYFIENINSESLTEKKFLYQEEGYDENNKLILEATYNINGEIEDKMVREFDDNSKLLKESTYYTEEDVVQTKEFVYNGDKIEQEKILFEEGGETLVNYHYENDKITKKETISDGEVDEEISYEYNDKEVVVKFIDEGELVSTERKLIDERKNLIRVERQEQFEDYVEEYEYDENNRRIAMQQSLNGNLINNIRFEFNAEGDVHKIKEIRDNREILTEVEFDERKNPVLQIDKDSEGNMITRIERKFDDNNEIVETIVEIDDQSRGVSSKYVLNFEYSYFE
jgi:antitoxin component YwqK of YwqJK toxin-antitoxin module